MATSYKKATISNLPLEVLNVIGKGLRWDEWVALLKASGQPMFVPSRRLVLFEFLVKLLRKFPDDEVFIAGGVTEFLNGYTNEFSDIDVFVEGGENDGVFQRFKQSFNKFEFRGDRGQTHEEYGPGFAVFDTDLAFETVHPVQIIFTHDTLPCDFVSKVALRLNNYDLPTCCGTALYLNNKALTLTVLPFGKGVADWNLKRGVARKNKYLQRMGCEVIPKERASPWMRFFGTAGDPGCLVVEDFHFGSRKTRKRKRGPF